MLLSQAHSALAGQHIQSLSDSAAGGGSIGNGVSSTVGHSGIGAADLLGVGGSLGLGGVDDVIGSEDLVLVQNGDSGLRSQRGYGAALHGNTPVGAGGKDRVGRADGLTGQYGDLDGGSLGVDTGHTGSLTDAASLIVALALAEALGVDDGHNGDAVGIAQTNEAGSLGGALVAQGGLLGGQDTNGAAVDGSQRGDDVLAVTCVQLHSAALIGQSGDRVSRRVLDEVKSFGGSGKVEQRRTGQIVGGQQGDDGGSLLGGGNGVRSGNGGDTGLGGANAASRRLQPCPQR